MSTITLNILLGVFTLILGILAFAEEVSKKTSIKFINNLIFKLITFFIISILIIWLNVLKDKNSDDIQKKNSEKFRHELKKQDSIYNEKNANNIRWYSSRIDSNNLTSFKSYISVLAKYNLHYDSSQNRIEKLVEDSTNNEIPSLCIFPERNGIVMQYNKTNDSINGKIELYNAGNCPILTHTKFYIIGEIDTTLCMGSTYTDDVELVEGQIHYVPFYLWTNSKFDNIYFLLKKNYSTLNKAKKISMIEIIGWNFTNNTRMYLHVSQQVRIKNFVKTHGYPNIEN